MRRFALPLSLAFSFATTAQAQADSPSFDCARARDGSIEKLVCSDAALSSLFQQSLRPRIQPICSAFRVGGCSLTAFRVAAS